MSTLLYHVWRIWQTHKVHDYMRLFQCSVAKNIGNLKLNIFLLLSINGWINMVTLGDYYRFERPI